MTTEHNDTRLYIELNCRLSVFHLWMQKATNRIPQTVSSSPLSKAVVHDGGIDKRQLHGRTSTSVARMEKTYFQHDSLREEAQPFSANRTFCPPDATCAHQGSGRHRIYKKKLPPSTCCMGPLSRFCAGRRLKSGNVALGANGKHCGKAIHMKDNEQGWSGRNFLMSVGDERIVHHACPQARFLYGCQKPSSVAVPAKDFHHVVEEALFSSII